MKPDLSSKAVLAFYLFFFIWHPTLAYAQETKKDEAKFVNLGYIGFSEDYILSTDLTFVTFKILNNTGRPITNIFAWVYRFKKDKDEKADGLVLVNNPNKGGLLVKGGSHAGGEIAEWRFPLANVKKAIEGETEWKYTLRVSPKSIFFGDKTLKRAEPNQSRKSQQ